MLIFGHKFIPSESFYHVTNIDAIHHTPPSSTIYLDFSEDNLDIINHATANGVKMALKVSNVTEVLYASSLESSFIVVSEELAKTAQSIADNYLFDAKILVMIDNYEVIEELALLGVDGVICSNAIIKTIS